MVGLSHVQSRIPALSVAASGAGQNRQNRQNQRSQGRRLGPKSLGRPFSTKFHSRTLISVFFISAPFLPGSSQSED